MLSQMIATPVGQMYAIWESQETLRSCSFIEPLSVDSSQVSSDEADVFSDCWGRPQQLLAERLGEYFRTGMLNWDLESLDWTAITPFHQRVLRSCYEIPRGATLSYANLAAQVGSPRAARAVGSAMARNRWPLLIPCHRVVGARGALTGYSGAGGIETKRRLLELESQHAAVSS